MSKTLSFPRARRLTQTSEFARVRAEGRVVRGELMNVAILEHAKEANWRAGFITSKRVGNAVVRNRVRRRLREIVRRNQHEIQPHTWLVLIARAAAASASYAELQQEWLRLATRGGALSA